MISARHGVRKTVNASRVIVDTLSTKENVKLGRHLLLHQLQLHQRIMKKKETDALKEKMVLLLAKNAKADSS